MICFIIYPVLSLPPASLGNEKVQKLLQPLGEPKSKPWHPLGSSEIVLARFLLVHAS